MKYDDYFGRPDKDAYTLVRVKREWLPDWAWWLAAHLDPESSLAAHSWKQSFAGRSPYEAA